MRGTYQRSIAGRLHREITRSAERALQQGQSPMSGTAETGQVGVYTTAPADPLSSPITLFGRFDYDDLIGFGLAGSGLASSAIGDPLDFSRMVGSEYIALL